MLLLKCLSYSFGVAGSVHSWIQSYLIGLSLCVSVQTRLLSCPVGVPQGSVLGPLLFSIYTLPIFTFAQSHQVHQQQYADDTQLYLALSPSSYTLDTCNKSSALAEMGDRLTTTDMGRKVGEAAVGSAGSPLGHHLTQCGLGRGLPLYQVAS